MMMKLSHRNFIFQTCCFIAVAALQADITQASTPDRPNVLWISCEDISSHLGCYGESLAITPRIDEFAKESVRYTRAFTVHGVCAPSRSGIITGMYPSTLGSVNMRCRASKPESIKCFTEYLRQAGYYCTNRSKEDYNFKTPQTAWDDSNKQAHWKNRPDGKPFFAVFNFTTTHESKLWDSAKFDNTHPKRLTPSQWQKPESVTVPPIYPDTLEVRRDFARLFERITEFDYFVSDRIDELKQAGLYDNTVIFIWSDHGNGLPRAKRWLYDSGTLVPLIIRVPERYRTNEQALPNSTDDQLINFIDLGPTVLNLTGLEVPESMQGQAFLGPDLPQQRKYIFGARQRIDELTDMVRSVRDERYRYIRNFKPYIPYLPYLAYAEKCNTMKAMRKLYAEGKLNAIQAQWMADHRPAEELYDLKNDPWETHNLAGDSKYAQIQSRLGEALRAWMIQERDTGVLPEPEMSRLTQQFGSEYQIFKQTGGPERVEKLVDLAMIASAPENSDLAKAAKAIDDTDPVARYWAVLAMRVLAKDNSKLIEKVHATAKDENPCVRIAAARALYTLGEKTAAISILEKELKQPNQRKELLRFALNELTLFGPEACSALETVKTLYQQKKQSKNVNYVIRISEHFIDQYSTGQ